MDTQLGLSGYVSELVALHILETEDLYFQEVHMAGENRLKDDEASLQVAAEQIRYQMTGPGGPISGLGNLNPLAGDLFSICTTAINWDEVARYILPQIVGAAKTMQAA